MFKLTNSISIIRIADGACIPADLANTDYAEYLLWLAKGNKPEPADVPTTAQVQATFTAAIQSRLDSFARTRGYDGILSASTYAASGVPRFAAEGQYAVSARDATWAAAYVILGDVMAGRRPMPTLEEVAAELPVLEWPSGQPTA